MTTLDPCPECNGTGGAPGIISKWLSCRACEGHKVVPVQQEYQGQLLDEIPEAPEGTTIYEQTCFWPKHPSYDNRPVISFVDSNGNVILDIGSVPAEHNSKHIPFIIVKPGYWKPRGLDCVPGSVWLDHETKQPLSLEIVGYFYMEINRRWPRKR